MEGKKGALRFCKVNSSDWLDCNHEYSWDNVSYIYITIQCFTTVSLHLQLDINSTVALWQVITAFVKTNRGL